MYIWAKSFSWKNIYRFRGKTYIALKWFRGKFPRKSGHPLRYIFWYMCIDDCFQDSNTTSEPVRELAAPSINKKKRKKIND